MRTLRLFVLFFLVGGPLVALLVFMGLVITKDFTVALDIFKGFIATTFLTGMVPAIITGLYIVFFMNRMTWINFIASTIGVAFSVSTIFSYYLLDEPNIALSSIGTISTAIVVFILYGFDRAGYAK